jgi:hypothetical protein
MAPRKKDGIINKKSFILSDNFGSSLDPIRDTLQSYWVFDAEMNYNPQNLYDSGTKSGTRGVKIDFIESDISIEKIKFDFDTVLTIPNFKETIEITPRYAGSSEALVTTDSVSTVDPEDIFDNYIINNIIPSLDIEREDYEINLQSPIEYASEVDNKSVVAGTVFYNYNYGLESYENAIAAGAISETKLYNFYNLIEKGSRSLIPPISTGAGVTVAIPISPSTKQQTKLVLRDSKGSSPEIIEDYFITHGNYIDSLGLLDKKENFPFYNQVYFTNPPQNFGNDDLKNTIFSSGLVTAFCDLLNRQSSLFETDPELATATRLLPFTNSYISSSYADPSQESFELRSEIKDGGVKLYDAVTMLNIMYSALSEEYDPVRISEYYKTKNSQEASFRLSSISKAKDKFDYENSLDDVVEEIQELINGTSFDNKRSYKEILSGEESYSSKVLFYKISKFEEGSNIPLQNFWIPSEPGYRGINYIDTQVKYGKKYKYIVYAYKFVIGSKYVFEEKPVNNVDFTEDLQNYINYIQEYVIQLYTIREIRTLIEDNLSQADFEGTNIKLDNIIFSIIGEYVENNSLEAFRFNDISAIKSNANKIVAFVNGVLSGTPTTYNDTEVSLGDLTENERIAFEKISRGWACLTNFGTDNGKLKELEIGFRKLRVLKNLQNIIRNGLDEQSIADGKKEKHLEGVVDVAVTTLGTAAGVATGGAAGSLIFSGGAVGAGLGFVTGLAASAIASLLKKSVNVGGHGVEDLSQDRINDIYGSFADLKLDAEVARAIAAAGGSATSDFYALDEQYIVQIDRPHTFDWPDSASALDKTVLGLSISTKAAKKGLKAADRKARERAELETLYYKHVSQQAKIFEQTVEEYLECFEDFVNSASGISILLDFKRANRYSLKATTKPSMNFAEIPYYTSEGSILDSPPLFPNINVVTYKGISNQLSFFMNSGQGSLEDTPVIFSESEAKFLQDYRRSRKLNDFQPILYTTDETENLGTSFEIRRLVRAPESMEDFNAAKIVRISNSISTGDKTPSAAYKDTIKNNTKYYYMFRVYDRRNTVSNPTSVYEIEIVENSGIIYPLIKLYDFPSQKSETAKGFKRLFNVVPRLSQVLPDPELSSYSGLSLGKTSILGRENERLFGKQFKIRLTSKKTGKSVDLNLDFTSNVVETTEGTI